MCLFKKLVRASAFSREAAFFDTMSKRILFFKSSTKSLTEKFDKSSMVALIFTLLSVPHGIQKAFLLFI